jgi:hypothetical protein
MGIIKRFLLISPLFFQSFFSIASNISNNPNPQTGDLYGYHNGKEAPFVTSPIINECSGTGQKSIGDCKSIMVTQINEQFANYGDGTTVRMTSRGSISYTQAPTNLSAAKPTWIEYHFDNPSRWVKSAQSSISKNATITQQSIPQCPPPNFTQYSAVGILADVMYCFDPLELSSNDSCEQEDDFYPSSGLNGVACIVSTDGSRCEYSKSSQGNYHQKSQINLCYIRSDFEVWTPSINESPSIDPTIQTPQDVGAGIDAFSENRDDVCDTNGNCNTGCGTITSGGTQSFVCLSPDSDLDGIADYVDPDIDGDGIRNDDDLDPDGDGQDNPVYQNAGSSSGSAGSTLALENLTSTGNAALGGIQGELAKQNGEGQMPAYSELSGDEDFNGTIMSRLNNSPVSQALSGMAGAINFNTSGSCPELSFYLPSPIDKTVSTSTHCSMMPAMRLIITPVMFAIYLFMGFRIFAAA